IDGGKGQLAAAVEAAQAQGQERLPIVSLAKREEEVFLPGYGEPLRLSRRSPSLKLLQRARDEAHRFAVTYSRKRRAQRTITSELLRIPGIGPARRRVLLERFGSLAGVREVCGSPYLVRYAALPSPEAKTLLRQQRWTMWRYDGWLPLGSGEHPITLGEGGTPLLRIERIAARHGFDHLWVKDESTNPT